MNVWGALTKPVAIPRDVGESRVHRIETTADFEAAHKALRTKPSANRRLPRIKNPWHLSPCQCRTAQLLSEGLSNMEIAQEMGVVPKTVEQHILKLRINMGDVSRVRAAVLWDRFIRGNEGQAC